MSNIKISIRNLSKSFGQKMVLNRVNLDIDEGGSLVIIGGSGSGKSVLLKCMIGLLEPDIGTKIMFNNNNIAEQHIKYRSNFISKFGMLFQGSALFDSMPVWQNICFQMLYLKKINKQAARDIAAQKLAMVGINHDVLDLYPSELSGGMQKRVGLARAIANNPEIIFFDEPTSGLDPINAKIVSELIRNLCKELKATTVTITHDMLCMNKIADKIAVLQNGNIVWQGTKDGIISSSNSYVDSFVKAAASYQ